MLSRADVHEPMMLNPQGNDFAHFPHLATEQNRVLSYHPPPTHPVRKRAVSPAILGDTPKLQSDSMRKEPVSYSGISWRYLKMPLKIQASSGGRRDPNHGY